MDLFDLSTEDRSKLAEICAHEGIDESYASFVARHIDAEDKTWRWCCSSSCDPCVHTLGRAVDRARHALRMGPGGLSGGTPTP